jgi:hypothetical protein
MSRQYIKLNDNDEHLSLGNLFRIIKESSKNKTSAMQSELFCLLFGIDSVNDTTVNNYCVGCRSIGNDYKQIYLNKNKKYQNNANEFCSSIIGLLNVIDGDVHTGIVDDIGFIDESVSALELARKLYNLAKNDRQVKVDFTNMLYHLLEEKKIYKCLVEELTYIVLVKKQPLYEDELKREVFENVLNDTSISSISLQEYLSLKLREGINFDYSMRKLAENGNAYANFEIGSDEYYGHVTGKPRYTEALKFLKRAAEEKHAAANYMVASIYIRGLVGNKSKEELEKGYKYLLEARELGNIAASNLLGNMYFDGIYPLEKDLNKAIECYKGAAEANYVFAINNLGKIEENNKRIKEAYEYYLKSADLGESWACNKIGEAYRTGILEMDGLKAFDYYNKALECNFRTLCYYAYHNLAKYYYLNGYDTIAKDYNKAIEYFKIAADNNIFESAIELFYIYAKDYKAKQEQHSYDEIMHYKKMIESHPKYDKETKDEIEKKLSEIRNKKEISIKSIEDLIR